MDAAPTKLQREIFTVLTDQWQHAGQIERARRAKGYKPMTTDGIRKSCENLAAKGRIARKFHGAVHFAAQGTPRDAEFAQEVTQ